MKWQKAPEELKVLLERVMTGIDCEKRSMFGFPAYFINQNMFAGLFQSAVFMRLSPEQLSTLTKMHPAISPREPMPGRPMKNHYAIPEGLYRNEDAFRKVAAEAAAHAHTLAPKEKSPAKKKAPTGNKGAARKKSPARKAAAAGSSDRGKAKSSANKLS